MPLTYTNAASFASPFAHRPTHGRQFGMIPRTDCLHFNGYKPCSFHKKTQVECENCKDYRPATAKVLIIKLRAAGEVIRNTPLLRKLEKEMPNAKIFWVTQFPELLPNKVGLVKLRWGFEAALICQDIEFDLVLSLDKDREACALANRVKAKVKKGFSQKDGAIVPFDEDCKRKWITGVSDPLMKQNKKHYVEEIFEICGFKFAEESYWLPTVKAPIGPEKALNRSKKVVALNTGVGEMWRPRLYSQTHWTKLSKTLLSQGYEVFLVGGPAEHAINLEIAAASGAHYFGTYPYTEFLGLLSLADVVVTCVSFAFHVAVGLGKPTVLLNNTFNRTEFYSYNKGVILEPELPCLMCYKNDFDDQCATRNCMDLIKPEQIAVQLKTLL